MRELTDTGNAERLIDKWGQRLRYVVEWKQWIRWNDRYWEEDETFTIVEMVKDTVRAIKDELPSGGVSAADLLKHCVRSQAVNRIEAVEKLARSIPGVPISAENLDKDIWLLGCENGTIDLRTGRLLEPDRDALVTKSTGRNYDPSAQCPKWLAYLKWVFQGDRDLIRYFQKAVGYTLTGSSAERLILFLHGIGRNGKTTVLNIISGVMGDYARKVSAELIGKSRSAGDPGKARPDLVRLQGARLIYASEVEDGTKLATAFVKEITGNEKITARQLFKAPVEFVPQFTAWVACNHKPNVPADDVAAWERIRLVPFNAQFDGPANTNLASDILDAEAEGILAWAVLGCLLWQQEGLEPPEAVNKATVAYQAEMDGLPEFIKYVLAQDNIDLRLSMFYECYKTWCSEEGYRALSVQDFAKQMRQHGWCKTSNNPR